MIHLIKGSILRLQTFNRNIEASRRKTILYDTVLSVFFFGVAVFISMLLSRIHAGHNQFSFSVFILVVALIARFTHSYIYGAIASLLGVFSVNFIFTYPYWEFDMSITGYPLTFAAMLVVSLCISTLTTQIKKQEQLHAIAEMEKMRANLLRSVSHDLRTPLTSIVGSSSVLLEDTTLSAEDRNELLLEINKEARRLAKITENILSVTKFSDGSIHLNKDYEVVEEIISSAIVKFRSNHPEIKIYVEKPEEILLAPMDATLIEQVIINLFDNALIHGGSTKEIKIHLREENTRTYISISDDGIGINANVLPHLFDGYASMYSHRSDESRNMGIGLSVCNSIIKAHSGEIKAYNIKNGGACLEFWLPSEKENENESA